MSDLETAALKTELEIFRAEDYFLEPNRSELIDTLTDLPITDIAKLQELDFEVVTDGHVGSMRLMRDHLVSAISKILKLYSFSKFVTLTIDMLEKRDVNPELVLQALGLASGTSFPDVISESTETSKEVQKLLKANTLLSETNKSLDIMIKKQAQEMNEFEVQFSGMLVLNDPDLLHNIVYNAKAVKENKDFKLQTSKEIVNLKALCEQQSEEIEKLSQLKYSDLSAIKKQIEDLQKKTKESKTHITGTKKAPELLTMNPIEYRAFKENFLSHSKTHEWTEDVSKQQLLLSVHSNIHSTLKMAVTNWKESTLDAILLAWDKRICPDSVASLAVMHLSGLQQNLNEDTIAYLTRGHELYVRARLPSLNPQDPETDKAFVLKLIHGIRDKNLVNHLRRWEPKTISELREKINSEMAIQNMDSTAQFASTSISKIDGMDSNEKPKPPCALCEDEKHATIHCNKLSETIAEFARIIKPTTSYLRGRGRGGNRGNTRGRGGNRGRGNGNGNGRGGNGKRPYQPNNSSSSSDSTPPKNVKSESDSKN